MIHQMNFIRKPYLPVVLAISVLLLSACGGGTNNSSDETNMIKITSVTPTPVTEGVLTTLTVSFSYRLQTKDAGTVYVGFNTTAENAYTLSPIDIPVDKGSGTNSFVVSVQPVAYKAPSTFKAYANLSERPHEATWTPLVSDYVPISVTPATTVAPSAQALPSKQEEVGTSLYCSVNDACAVLAIRRN